MQNFDKELLKKLYIPPSGSHKGKNGKLLLIGGSSLFHAASLWALTVASRVVDMVFYSSVPENNEIVLWAKEEFRNGIVVPRNRIEDYVEEADCILIGPGMMRIDKSKIPARITMQSVAGGKSQISKIQIKSKKSENSTYNLEQINRLSDEGEQTYWLTKYLLEKYPQKKWIIDAGALQVMEPEWLQQLNGNVIITPHPKEFETLFMNEIKNEKLNLKNTIPSYAQTSLKLRSASEATAGKQKSKIEQQTVSDMAKKYNCIILLKGREDIICSPKEGVSISGGNAGMTKGGTGDVLAGLVASLACKNELFISACAGSYLNKKAGEQLFEKVGYYFNSSDLANEIPSVMKKYILATRGDR